MPLVAWSAIANDPYSNEAGAAVNGSVLVSASSGAANNGNNTVLTFSTGLNGLYNPSVNGLLTLNFAQSYFNSSAAWSNISVTLNPFVAPVAPTAINLGGISGASLNFNTEGSSLAPSNDTEIGVFDSNGFLLGNDDDSGTGFLSSLNLAGLADGTYYISVSGFNTEFSNGFGVATTSANIGNTVINVTNGTDTLTGGSALAAAGIQWYTITVPTPGAAALLGLGGLMAARRRRA